jgi:hypothetical protein
MIVSRVYCIKSTVIYVAHALSKRRRFTHVCDWVRGKAPVLSPELPPQDSNRGLRQQEADVALWLL